LGDIPIAIGSAAAGGFFLVKILISFSGKLPLPGLPFERSPHKLIFCIFDLY
jgi:hypothetical protein